MISLRDLSIFGEQWEKLGISGKLAVIGAAAFAMFSFGECTNYDKLKEFEIKYKQLQEEADSTKKIANEEKTKVSVLATEVRNRDTTIRRLTISIEVSQKQREKLKGGYEVLAENLREAKDTAEMFHIQEGMIANLNEQLKEADNTITQKSEIIQNQKYQISKLDEALAIANTRGDRLQTQLDKFTALKMPTPHKPLISKKVSSTIAFIGGVYLGNRLAK